MQRGNLIIYDETGKIFSQSGEAEGDVLAHEYPTGLPYLEIPFGTMALKRVVSIDTSVTPHVPVTIMIDSTPAPFTPLKLQPTLAELADNQLILMDAMATLYEAMLAKGTV